MRANVIIKCVLKVSTSRIPVILTLIQHSEKVESFLFFSEFDFRRSFPFTLAIYVKKKIQEGKSYVVLFYILLVHLRCNKKQTH